MTPIIYSTLEVKRMEDGEGGVHKRSLAAQIETKLNQFQYLVFLLNAR